MGDLPEYIRIEAGKITKAFPGQEDDDNTYKFIDSGASGKVYLKNTGDSVIKLLFSNDYESEKQFKENHPRGFRGRGAPYIIDLLYNRCINWC